MITLLKFIKSEEFLWDTVFIAVLDAILIMIIYATFAIIPVTAIVFINIIVLFILSQNAEFDAPPKIMALAYVLLAILSTEILAIFFTPVPVVEDIKKVEIVKNQDDFGYKYKINGNYLLDRQPSCEENQVAGYKLFNHPLEDTLTYVKKPKILPCNQNR